MKAETLDYAELEQEVLGLIDRNRTMVLATCADARVTARMMSVIHDGLTLYFQTGQDSTKYQQMAANPQVALCIGNLAIEGRAALRGHPLAPESRFFAETYRRLHRGSYDTYSALPSNRMVEVQPILVTLWKYDADGKPFRDFLDVAERRAWREVYPLE
jgi:general stress protein 26